MNKVDRCLMRPLHCAVFPTLGAAHRKGYYDTGVNLDGPGIHENRVYISVEAVEHLAGREGWVSSQEAQVLLDANEQAQATITELQEQLDAAEAVVDAIDTIESRDFRARKKPGKPKVKAPA